MLTGAFVNGLLIIIGSVIGLFFRQIPTKMKDSALMIIGLCVVVLGLQMSLESTNFIIILISLTIGTMLGEWLDIERFFEKATYKIESIILKERATGKVAEGFIFASLIFVIGSMAIIGAIDSGVKQDHTVLITKGIIDGVMSIFLASTLGIGVLFSAIPVFFYEGGIALAATMIDKVIPETILTQLIIDVTATGGIMIIAIGLNIAKITNIRVANVLPSLVIVALISWIIGCL